MIKRRTSIVVGAVVLGMVGAACGSSSGAPTAASKQNSASAGSSATASASPNMAAVEATLSKYSSNPTSIGYDAPLPSAPPKGKLIVALGTPVGIAAAVNQSRAVAAQALGWTLKVIDVGTGPQDPANAFTQALGMKPNAIVYAGYPRALFTQQLAKAKAQHVTVISESDTGPLTPPVDGIDRNAATTDTLAKISAAKVIADTRGKAHVELFGTTTFPILAAYNSSFQHWMTTWCPTCTVTVNNFQLTDIGTTLPTDVVSVLQRSPSTNYLIFGFGDAMVGVEPAMKSAGLLGKVKIGGAIPDLAQYAALRSGTDAFWVQDTPPWISWRETDMMARSFMGLSLSPPNQAPLPVQILTPQNIGSAQFNSQGYWIGYSGYAAAFKSMWHLSS